METITVGPDDVVLSRESIGWVVEALIIGLTSYGELEKVFSAQKTVDAIGGQWPAYLDVRHPTGDSDVVAKFACALQTLNV
jgi:hypothetical protein